MKIETFNKEVLNQACSELCRRDFGFFVKEFWSLCIKDELIWNWHLDKIIADLEEIAFNLVNGKPKTDYLLNIFPGASKSSILSKLYPAWLWAVAPELVVITISYGDKLANDNAMASRDIILSEKYQQYFPLVKIRPDFNKIEHYKNTLGGERITTTPSGTLTGFHGSIIICDELQNVKKASSAIERENLNQWLNDTLPSRKKSPTKTPTIFCQQRLHVNDATGFLMASGMKFKRLCIPIEENESLYPESLSRHYKQGLCFPERFPKQYLEETKEFRGSRVYNTQYLMNPSSDEGSILKEDWFKRMPDAEFQEIIKGKNIVYNFYIDSGVGEKKKNDPSAILACCKIDFTLYITAVETRKLEFFKMTEFIKTWVNQHGFTKQSKCFIEPKSTGPAFVDYLMKQSDLNVMKGADPRDSKEDRLMSIQPTIQGGKVVLVENGQWNIDKFISECTATSPIHDDQRDVLVASCTAEIINKPANYGNYSWR